MSKENVELARRGYRAWNGTSREEALAFLDPNVEWHTSEEDPDGGIYYGHRGVERLWNLWEELFGEIHVEPEEFLELDDDRVMVTSYETATAQESGVEVSLRIHRVLTFSGGKAVRVDEYLDRPKALEAVGGSSRGADGSI